MEIACGIFLLLGSIFSFISALGVLRFPDFLLRMHASTKAGTMGISLILIAIVIQNPSFLVVIKTILIILFIFITAPVGAQMIARAAYFIKTPLCKETVIDELKEYYKD
jgi:multicomponent Na+:H+ antiporter subunit G